MQSDEPDAALPGPSELVLSEAVPADEPAEIRIVFAYWQRLRGDRAMPARSELDVIGNVPLAAGNLFLVDVSAAAPRFTLRLVGSKIEQRIGLTRGIAVEALDVGSELGAILEQYERTVRDGRPSLCVHSWVPPGGKPIHYHRLLLPLGKDGVVTHLLGCIVFFDWERNLSKQRVF